jgi:hypothetical protein
MCGIVNQISRHPIGQQIIPSDPNLLINLCKILSNPKPDAKFVAMANEIDQMLRRLNVEYVRSLPYSNQLALASLVLTMLYFHETPQEMVNTDQLIDLLTGIIEILPLHNATMMNNIRAYIDKVLTRRSAIRFVVWMAFNPPWTSVHLCDCPLTLLTVILEDTNQQGRQLYWLSCLSILEAIQRPSHMTAMAVTSGMQDCIEKVMASVLDVDPSTTNAKLVKMYCEWMPLFRETSKSDIVQAAKNITNRYTHDLVLFSSCKAIATSLLGTA